MPNEPTLGEVCRHLDYLRDALREDIQELGRRLDGKVSMDVFELRLAAMVREVQAVAERVAKIEKDQEDRDAQRAADRRLVLAAFLLPLLLALPGWYIAAQDGNSWAGTTGRTVHRYGPRDLIGEARRALAWWRERGKPSLYDFGITVTADGQPTMWLETEDNPVCPLTRTAAQR